MNVESKHCPWIWHCKAWAIVFKIGKSRKKRKLLIKAVMVTKQEWWEYWNFISFIGFNNDICKSLDKIHFRTKTRRGNFTIILGACLNLKSFQFSYQYLQKWIKYLFFHNKTLDISSKDHKISNFLSGLFAELLSFW